MKRIDKDITKAFTLPGSFYSSEDFFFKVKKDIFEKSWQLVTHESNIKSEKDVFPFRFLDDFIKEPLFLVKNKDIDCFSNVCTHRGNLLLEEPCNIGKSIFCKYHGRRFDSCGKFLSMPETKDMQDFPSERDNLSKVSTKKWKQFIFASLEPSFSFDRLVNDIEARVGWMPIEDFSYREDLSKEYTVDANWALYCDNYLECFHCPFVHKGLSAVLKHQDYHIELFPYSSLQVGVGKDESDCFDLPKDSIDYGKNIAAYYFWLFPNTMLNFYPWGLSINIVKPISVNKTKVEFKSYVWKEEKLDLGAGASLEKVELEDEEIVESVQKGVLSRFYEHGRFSPKMEKGVHHFHCLISDFINKD
ncbi:choline monooxygenase [bacterium]|nr:choline monooxygenase [bacterium]|tara:strand:- start:20 stop:1099 length:1080 start_codon:yes stop_codon:yes gene_type:complete